MIINSYSGTETWGNSGSPTAIWGDCCITSDHVNHVSQLMYDAKWLSRVTNAAKATETMIIMGKLFCQTMKTLVVMLITPVLRLCFCKSGYLPGRIKRIRKGR